MSKNMSWAGFIPKWFSLRLEIFNLVGFPSSFERRLGPLSLARVGARKACARQAPKEQKTLLLRLLSPLVFPVKPIWGGNYRNHHGITPGKYRRSFFSTNSEAKHFPGISLVSVSLSSGEPGNDETSVLRSGIWES
jgi:hypothetical protein